MQCTHTSNSPGFVWIVLHAPSALALLLSWGTHSNSTHAQKEAHTRFLAGEPFAVVVCWERCRGQARASGVKHDPSVFAGAYLAVDSSHHATFSGVGPSFLLVRR